MADNDKYINGGGRDTSLDIVAGLLMLIVLMHHAGILKSYPFSLMHIFNFFMPWFFFKAGMFHKFHEKIDKALIIKYCKRYVVPLIFCSVSSYLLYLINHKFIVNYNIGSILSDLYNANGVIWFLISLLLVKILMLSIPCSKHWGVIIVSGLFVVSGYLVNKQLTSVPLFIKEVIAASLYYSVGCYWGKQRCEKWSMIIALMIIYSTFIVLQPSKIDMRMQYVMFGEYGMAVIGNIIGIITINSIARKINNHMPSCISYIGVESMSYYILHIQIFIVVGYLCGICDLSDSYIPYVQVLATLIIVPIIGLILRRLHLAWLLGK